jgi:uncharacterized LabA/DUF88 family protein
VDGNNWYHALREAQVPNPGSLDYGLISSKLVRAREWLATRYYIGQVPQERNLLLYANQRRFLARLRETDPRISVHFGRVEFRNAENPVARELLEYLARLWVTIDARVQRELEAIGRRHRRGAVAVEKAVDVLLAVDMVVMAARDQFDVAYLLSSDGDFTPAVEAVRAHGKKLFAVSLSHGGRLRSVCDAFIHIDRGWLGDCLRSDRHRGT